MAFRSAAKNDTAGTAGVVTKPAGTIDGDILVAWCITDSASGTVTWPGGFTETSVTPLRTSTTDASSLFVATKVASGEGASYSITLSSAGKRGMAAFSGRDTVSPINKISGVTRTTATATPWPENSAAFGSVTTATCDIAMIVDDDIEGAVVGPVIHTPPAGFTTQIENNGADIFQGVLYTKDDAASGETGSYTGTGTLAGSAGADRSIVVIALAAAAGGGGGGAVGTTPGEDDGLMPYIVANEPSVVSVW